jgi:hypothetical protein
MADVVLPSGQQYGCLENLAPAVLGKGINFDVVVVSVDEWVVFESSSWLSFGSTWAQ